MKQMNKGTTNELKAAIWYLEQGWVPFFPLHHDTSIDLLVSKGPRCKRIQVKTVYDCGGLLRCNLDNNYSADNVDVLVCVLGERMWVIPMEDVEDISTLNFGRTDGTLSKSKSPFNHRKYEVTK